MLLITKVFLGFLVVLTVAEAVPVLQLNTTSVVDPIPLGGSSLLADDKTGPYRLTFFKSAIGNKDTTNENINKTVEVLMKKSNEEINQTVHDESSMEEGDPIEMKFTGGDWSKKLTKIIDKESSSGIDSSSSSSEEDSSSSSSSEEDSSENGSGDSSESSEEEEEGSEEEEEEESKEEEEEEGEGGSEEEEEGEEEEEEKEEENEEEEEEEEEENEEEDEEGKEIEKVLNVDIKKTSAAVITPAGTQLMNSSDRDVYFHEMQRHHKKFGSNTKGTKLLFTTGLIPSPFYSHFLQDNSIIPSSVVQQQTSTTPSSNNIKTIMYSDWLKSLPEMKKLFYPSHPHFISSSIVKPIKKQNKADDVMMNKSSGNQLTPGGTTLVSDDDHFWLSYRINDDVMYRQPSLLDDDSVQRFFRSAAAFRTLSPPPPQ